MPSENVVRIILVTLPKTIITVFPLLVNSILYLDYRNFDISGKEKIKIRIDKYAKRWYNNNEKRSTPTTVLLHLVNELTAHTWGSRAVSSFYSRCILKQRVQ